MSAKERIYEKFLDGTLGSAGSTGFNNDRDQQEKCDDTGSLEICFDQSRQNSQCHKLIHVNFAAYQIFHRGDDDGQSKDESTEKCRHMGCKLLFREQCSENE